MASPPPTPDRTRPVHAAAQLRAAMGSACICLAQSVLLLAMLLPACVGAATPGQPDGASNAVGETLNRRGDLTLRDATLEGALFTISELWGVNIVSAGAEGTVNGVFKDAPLREILDSILISNGYGYRTVGASLVVSRVEALGQLNPFFVSETIPLGSADPQEVVQAAQLLTTPGGKVQALPTAGAVLVVDFPDRVARVRELVETVDASSRGRGRSAGAGGPQQLEVAYFRTHFLAAGQAVVALDVVRSPVGRIAAIEGEDRILVVDYPENVRMVEAVLARIDRPRPQVNIKALIYDIALTDIEQIGVNWNGVANGTVDATTGLATAGDGFAVNSVTKQPFRSTNNGNTFNFFTINPKLSLDAIVRALQQADDSRLLADPNVTVTDNQQATLESISEIPYQQLTQTAAGGQIGTTAFKRAGIKLDVLPKVARDGTIDMQVTPEYSRLTGYTTTGEQPIIDTRRATTRVRVQDGQTLMIAGLRQRVDVGTFNGIPYLKDVRYLGHLFRGRDTQIRESELVVFLTPEITGFSDGLGERDQRTADTIHCRLSLVPAAEGCPECAPCALSPAVDPADAPIAAPADGLLRRMPSIAPPPTDDATLPPPITPIEAGAARPVAPNSEDSAAGTPRLVNPAVAGKTPAGVLRKGFDERFRASAERVATNPEVGAVPQEQPQAAQPAGEKSFFGRFFR